MNSLFAQRFGAPSGIERLMDDLGRALAGGQFHMLGGGNPAAVPDVQAVWRRRMAELLANGAAFDRMLLHYDTPRGNLEFLETVARFLRRNFGWEVGPDNLAVTHGAQTAFFGLFNLLGGPDAAGRMRRILLPLMPEYIGYAGQGLAPGLFAGAAPRVELLGGHRFKYHIDFDRLPWTDDLGAVCVSRPTNPTGNVLTDDEVARLAALARERSLPLILDQAYGAPFPHILFRDVRPAWDPGMILVQSLSKLGLPGARTGLVIAPPPIAAALTSMNSILSLASGNLGQALTRPLFESDEILRLSRDVIRPFYERKSRQALAWLDEFMEPGAEWRAHVSEGALFLWLWLPGLPISSTELYQRLKQRGVLVVDGAWFFYGGGETHPHARECIRISYAMDDESVREGLRGLAEEIRRARREG